MSTHDSGPVGARPRPVRVPREALPAVKRDALDRLEATDKARRAVEDAGRVAELAARAGVSVALAKVMVDMENVVSTFPPAEREAAALGVYHDADGVLRTRHQMLRAVPSPVPGTGPGLEV